VRDASVVVAGPDGAAGLVAFYAAPATVPPDAVAAALRAALPAHLVPDRFHRLAALALTANGKIDRTALTALAGRLPAAEADGADPGPCTPTERRLAAAWAAALRVPPERIRRRDHFFDLGGTSLSALRLVAHLDRLVTVADLVHHPVLADLARMIDAQPGPGPADRPG
jgi:hypothetical protein